MKKILKVDFTVKSMCQLAMFMAITLILSYVNEIIPSLPQGGTISVDVIAIMLCGYLMGAGYGVICGIGVSILQFVLGLATYYGPWSVLLDYVLPLAVCGLTPLKPSYLLGYYFCHVFKILISFCFRRFLVCKLCTRRYESNCLFIRI